MEVLREQSGEVLVLTPKKSDDPKEVAGFSKVRNVVHEALGGGAKRIVLDIGEIDFMNSTDIGALIGSVRHVQGKGGVLCMTGISPKLVELFTLVRLFQVVPMRLAMKDAVAEVNKVKLDGRANASLVAGNPTAEEVGAWSDAPAESGRKTLAAKEAVPDAETARGQVPRTPQAGAPGTGEQSSESSRRLMAPPWKDPTEDTDDLDPAMRDWVRALEVLRAAHDICRGRGVRFQSGMTFQQFLATVADSLLEPPPPMGSKRDANSLD